MNFLLALIILTWLGIMGLGVYFEIHPVRDASAARRWWPKAIGGNLVLFAGGLLAALALGMQEAFAATATAGGAHDVSIGFGLAMLGAAVPTAVATIGAGMAVGTVGAAAMALIGEKPEMFGRTLIYVGLAEGIAIYGLVISILMLGKL